MNENVYEEAEQIIRNRRNRAKRENLERMREVENHVPEIREINKHLSGLSKRLLAIIQSGTDIQERIKREERSNKQAQSLVKSYLNRNGYPDDYIEIKYTCTNCSDTGSHDGRYCECFKTLVKNLSIERMNIGTQLKLSTFETFDLTYYGKFEESMRSIYKYCYDYAENFKPSTAKNIFMYGETGLGKTHLSLAIASIVIEKGYSVAYDSAINYLQRMQKEQFGRGEENTDTLENVLSADLLIIDDLGAEYDSKFHIPNIYNIINTRINRSLPTIISTNLNYNEIEERYDMRIASRIGNIYDSLAFRGTDIRFLKRGGDDSNMYKKNDDDNDYYDDSDYDLT